MRKSLKFHSKMRKVSRLGEYERGINFLVVEKVDEGEFSNQRRMVLAIEKPNFSR